MLSQTCARVRVPCSQWLRLLQEDDGVTGRRKARLALSSFFYNVRRFPNERITSVPGSKLIPTIASASPRFLAFLISLYKC